jgi:hypothetical protein
MHVSAGINRNLSVSYWYVTAVSILLSPVCMYMQVFVCICMYMYVCDQYLHVLHALDQVVGPAFEAGSCPLQFRIEVGGVKP